MQVVDEAVNNGVKEITLSFQLPGAMFSMG